MDVTKIPFNQFIGLKKSTKDGFLLMLEDRPVYRNHVDTAHASAQFALAEATSGYFLLKAFSEITDIVPVVRKVEIKFRKPAADAIFSKAKLFETEKNDVLKTFKQKGKATLKVEVALHTETNVLVMQAVFEWFVTKK